MQLPQSNLVEIISEINKVDNQNNNKSKVKT